MILSKYTYEEILAYRSQLGLMIEVPEELVKDLKDYFLIYKLAEEFTVHPKDNYKHILFYISDTFHKNKELHIEYHSQKGYEELKNDEDFGFMHFNDLFISKDFIEDINDNLEKLIIILS